MHRAVGIVLAWGRARGKLDGATAIGIDAITWRAGHRYLTLAYPRRRSAAAGRRGAQDRHPRALLQLVRHRTRCGLGVVCSDMWKAYLTVVRKRSGQAPHVLDRFHVAGKLGEMIDKVRAAEARELKRRSNPSWPTCSG